MSPVRPSRFAPLAAALGLALLAWTCATTSNSNAAKYPPRGRRCKVHVYNSSTPGVKEWDDLGIARVECPLDVGRRQCLDRLREEACRMGGDLLYDVPKKGQRPGEQALVYQGHVAHTRITADAGPPEEAPAETEDAFDTTSPVEPLAVPAAASPSDAAADAGRD
jgi:hypothetical protein